MSDNITPYNSDEYDENVVKSVPYYEDLHETAVDIVKTVNPFVRNWLDTGCGTGFLAGKAVKVFPECKFTLADPSSDMLKEARKRLSEYSNVVFLQPVTSEDLSIKSGPLFDVITAIQSHHYSDIETRKKAIEKCYSLLTDNGIIIIFEHISPENKKNVNFQIDRWLNFQRKMGKPEDDINHHRKRYNTEFFPIKISEHIELLKSVGFKRVEVIWCAFIQAGFFGMK